MNRRVAFGWSGTLVPELGEFHTTKPAGLAALVYNRAVREGTFALMRQLQAEGWEVWIYTLAPLPKTRLKLFFALNGVSLGGVITGHDHASAVRNQRAPSRSVKHPPAFGIDLMIDDKTITAQAGRQLGFATHQITTHPKWTEPILSQARGLKPAPSLALAA